MKFTKTLFATVIAFLALAVSSQAFIITGGPGSITPAPRYQYRLPRYTVERSTGEVVLIDTNSFWAGAGIMANAIANAPWSVLAGYGHSISGSRSIAFVDVAYQFNNAVGLVAGYDELWAPNWAKAVNNGHNTQTDSLKGGVTLSAQVHPFAFIGSTFLTNIVASPFAGDLLATPKNGNAIGNIVTIGANFDFVKFGNFELSGAGLYENRQGQAYWDANYGEAAIVFSRLF